MEVIARLSSLVFGVTMLLLSVAITVETVVRKAFSISLGGVDELRITEQRHDRTTSKAAFSGGVPGRFYLISNRVRTFDDRVLARSIVMQIAVRKAAR